MTCSYTLVDAFTNTPFSGNPAAVFVLDAPRPAEWMQLVAREMNLSETAFLLPEGAGYRIRWFTPTVEVPLCGHATLASAHTLYESGSMARDLAAHFYSMSGELGAAWEEGWIALDFPVRRPLAVEEPPSLAAALGISTVEVWQYDDDLLALLSSGIEVRSLSPDITAIKALPGTGLIVTAAGDEAGVDFVSRYFAPVDGINEDPVTGSAHCVLAPFWASRLNKREMTGYQASARGGIVRVRVDDGDRVRLLGHAVTVAHNELVTD